MVLQFIIQDISLENSADFYLCFWLALLHSVSYFFFLYRSPSSALCTVFDSISSNIDEVLSINPSANVFVFGDFNVHHKDWLTYSSGTDRSGELCYNFSISNDLTQMVNFPLMLVVVLQWLYLHWEILIMLLSQFSYSQQDALFYCIAYDYFHMDWHGLNGHLRDVSWEDIFKCFCCC